MKKILFVLMMMFPVAAFAMPAKVQVIATFSILGDIVTHVGGDKVDLTILVPADSDAHTFEPTPKESIALSKAQVVFENGLHFEYFIDDLYHASGSSATRVVVTTGIKPRTFDVTGNINEIDPHAWHDVNNVIVMVKNIEHALIELDPAQEVYYQQHADNYIAQLTALDQWIENKVQALPNNQRKLVTSHDALGYFAARYDFKVIGAVIPSATTEAEDPSAKQMAALFDTIKSNGVKAVFIENMHSGKIATVLAHEAHVKVAPALYTDALGDKGSDGDSYIKMMQHNVQTIVEALK